MLDEFWKTAGDKLADRWMAAAGPALLFWAGAVLVWAYHRHSWHALRTSLAWVVGQPVAFQVAVLAGGLAVLLASAVLVQRLTSLALRVAEGYWPRCLDGVRDWRVQQVTTKVDANRARHQDLAQQVLDPHASLSRRDRDEYVRLDQAGRRMPGPGRRMPTKLGNTLRAGETRPRDKYGLDVITVWPHLWLLLPDSVRAELTTARNRLDASLSGCVWGVLFIVFTPWAWWAILVGPIVAVLAYYGWAIARAKAFADLLEASFDLYRVVVYRQLRWPLPGTPAAENRQGQLLSAYLLRGSVGDTPAFVPDQPASE